LQAIAELPEEMLHRGLTHLQAAEFLYETRLFPELEYAFKHALTHEVAYSSLLQERRRALHARIVEAVERLYADRLTEQVERLAHHALRSEVWEKAVVYCRQAGTKAAARSAHREAVACWEQALVALQHLPENPDTMRQRIDLHFDVRVTLHPLNAFAQILPHLRAAERLAEALGDSQRLARCLAYLGDYFIGTFQYAQAIEVSQRALALATAHGDGIRQLDAQYRLGLAYFTMGDSQQAITLLTKIVKSLTGDLEHAFLGYSAPLSVVSRFILTLSFAMCGAFAEGLTRAEEAACIAEAVDHPLSHMFAAMALGYLSLMKGDFTQASTAFERFRALGERVTIPSMPEVTVALGLAYVRSGRVTQALALVEQAMERHQAMPDTAPSSSLVASLGHVYLLAGRLEEARHHAEQALTHAREHQERGYQAYALRLLGDIAARREPPESTQAEAYYRQALALANELGMRPLQAHCHWGLGTLYATTGQREQARIVLCTAIDLYRAMDMTFWLPQTEEALAQVEGQ
jgi:tetratricopeptide (TPR) repeat protein